MNLRGDLSDAGDRDSYVVVGGGGVRYTLGVSRNARLEIEPNDSTAQQEIARTKLVRGTIGTIGKVERPTTFALFGDFGDGGDGELFVSRMVNRWDIDFIVSAGDNEYGHIDVGDRDWDRNIGAFYGSFVAPRSDGRYSLQTSPTTRFFPAVGNHDVRSSSRNLQLGQHLAGYLDYFHFDPSGEHRLPVGTGAHGPLASFYDFRKDDVHFFILDSESALLFEEAADLQRRWIRTQLGESDARWKFVVLHHTPYSSGEEGGTPAFEWDDDWQEADVVFAGHEHIYDRIHRDGLIYFVCGIGGRPMYGLADKPTFGSRFRFNETNGAMRISDDEAGVKFQLLSVDDGALGALGGTVVDEFELGELGRVDPVDRYTVTLEESDRLSIRAYVPAFDNPSRDPDVEFDLELRDETGRLLAETAKNVDSFHAQTLSFEADVAGVYDLEVLGHVDTGGDYALEIDVVRSDPFLRGDFDSDGARTISDGIRILRPLFPGELGETGIEICPDAADSNDDGRVNLSDAPFLFMFLFHGGDGPPPPTHECGRDPTEDALGCHRVVGC